MTSDLEKTASSVLYRGDGGSMLDAGAAKALDLFHRAARQVPAYRHFLASHKVDPDKIRTITDFRHVPPVEKNSYLREYPLDDLVFPDRIGVLHTLSASSGSTGRPFFWPRGDREELEGAAIHESIFAEFFRIRPETRALCVVCFAMGTWIAGTYTHASVSQLSNKGWRLRTITPGIDKTTLLQLLAELMPSYETVVLAGYPPYLKDILDEGVRRRIPWKTHDIRLLLAGEAVPEELRTYLSRRAGITEPLRDIITLYGTADAAIVGHETPFSNALRRAAWRRPTLRRALFDDERLPSLVQYHPERKYFEVENRELLFTTDWGIPLIRYRIGDEGGIFSYQELTDLLSQAAPGLLDRLPNPRLHWRLPFVYLFGRRDLTASLYAVLIYPENLKAGLSSREIAGKVTGKFIVSTEYRADQDQYLRVRVELKPGVTDTAELRRSVTETITRALLRHNIEYRKLHESLGNKVVPQVELNRNGDPHAFEAGNKQRWVQ